MGVLLFLFQVIAISLSGVIAPGPLTASAIAIGARNRYAGLALALGHGIIEFPLMVLIMFGLGAILKSAVAQTIIGFAGGFNELNISENIKPPMLRSKRGSTKSLSGPA